VPKRAILIQEQTPTRNVDSKTCAPRFDYCEPKARRRVLQHNHFNSGHGVMVTARQLCANGLNRSRGSSLRRAAR
jgi:hypothetical protein